MSDDIISQFYTTYTITRQGERHMSYKIKVYIASPYTKGDCAVNVRRQMLCADTLMSAGYAPYAPLPATHFQHMMQPRSYEEWTSQDLEWVEACDVLLRLDGESTGADGEVAFAKKIGIPVVYSIEELVRLPPGSLRRMDDFRANRAAYRTLVSLGYTYTEGAEHWQPPLGKPPVWVASAGGGE